MKTIKSCLTGLLFISFFLSSCKKDEVSLRQLLVNGNVETGSTVPNGWWNSTGQGKHNITWTDEASFSPKKSLKISTQIVDPSNFSFWAQTISSNLPNGKGVTLMVKIKSNLKGTGVSIAIRGDDASSVNGYAKQFVTTQGTSPISGIFDWTDYSIKLSNVDSSIQSLTVYLIYLGNTTGEVYFDDVSLTF
jgi:hypothetical protein